jgi:iron(III) transport system permease protein
VKEALTWYDPANAALLRSLAYAGLTALIASAIALLLAIGLDRTRSFTRSVVLFGALGSVAIPGIVLAFGYILVWNRLPGFRDFPPIHYGEASLLVMGYVAAALPYCLVIIMSAVDQLSPGLVDAARLQGVGRLQRVVRIILPLVALSALTAFLFTFLRTIFELPMSQMLIPQSGPPVPAMITRLFSHDGDGLACALSLVAMMSVGCIALAIWSLAHRYLWFGVRPDREATLVVPLQAKEGTA